MSGGSDRRAEPEADDVMHRVIAEYGPSLARTAWGYATNASDHDDLMQDILLAVWRALPRFRHAASEKTFVLRIAHNRGVTFALRRRRREPDPDPEARRPEDTPDPSPSPEDRLIGDQRRERLIEAVRRLDEPLRQTIMLYLEGLSTREIADVQGISESNASVRLTRGRAALRAYLVGADD
ncbi:MAG TPA: sigma-70 family RNA polymerase sigma factor [Gemmatimonadaceae bacterium]|jgi:RNA polymerase sigma-70 factor (ECF subfamily)|nr:sigma-70 family RNA polymerase sigma factor [Gemmatimonadaceae bacterium]